MGFPHEPLTFGNIVYMYMYIHATAKVIDFYNVGPMVKSCSFCRNQPKFHLWAHKKRQNISCKFQLEITGQVIGQKRVTEYSQTQGTM